MHSKKNYGLEDLKALVEFVRYLSDEKYYVHYVKNFIPKKKPLYDIPMAIYNFHRRFGHLPGVKISKKGPVYIWYSSSRLPNLDNGEKLQLKRRWDRNKEWLKGTPSMRVFNNKGNLDGGFESLYNLLNIQTIRIRKKIVNGLFPTIPSKYGLGDKNYKITELFEKSHEVAAYALEKNLLGSIKVALRFGEGHFEIDKSDRIYDIEELIILSLFEISVSNPKLLEKLTYCVNCENLILQQRKYTRSYCQGEPGPRCKDKFYSSYIRKTEN